MKKIHFLILGLFLLISVSLITLPLISNRGVLYTIRLDHERPVIGRSYKSYTYLPVDERAYIITEHTIMTNHPTPGHFPDDGKILENNVRAWWYWVDFPYGVKAFITEEVLLPFYLRIIPLRLRLLFYPDWVKKFYPLVAEELKKDGGWEKRVAMFKMSSRAYNNEWKEWEADSERNRRLYEEKNKGRLFKEDPFYKPDDDFYTPEGDSPFKYGIKGG